MIEKCLRCGALPFITKVYAHGPDGELVNERVCLCHGCRQKGWAESAAAVKRMKGAQP